MSETLADFVERMGRLGREVPFDVGERYRREQLSAPVPTPGHPRPHWLPPSRLSSPPVAAPALVVAGRPADPRLLYGSFTDPAPMPGSVLRYANADNFGWSPDTAWVPVARFGQATGGDWHAVLQAAFASGEPVELGPQDYSCSAPVVVTNTSVSVRGVRNRSRIVFTGTGGGLVITQDSALVITLQDFCVLASVGPAGDGVSLFYEPGIVVNDRFTKMVTLRGLLLGGVADDAGAWANGLSLVNVNNPTIEECFIRGQRNLSAASGTADRQYLAGTRGILVSSTDDCIPVVTKISKCHIRAVETCVTFEEMQQGCFVLDSELINCRDGVSFDLRSSVATPPNVGQGIFVRGNTITPAGTAVAIVNVGEGVISDNEVIRFAPVNGVNFTGLSMTACSEFNVHHNTWNGYNNQGTPGTVTGMFLTNTKRSRFNDNLLYKVNENIAVENAGSVNLGITGTYADIGPAVIFRNGALGDDNFVGVAGGQSRTASNAALVTVTASETTIAAVSLHSTPLLGQKYRVTAQWTATKGGTAGFTRCHIRQISGTGTALFEGGRTDVFNRPGAAQTAAAIWEGQVGGVIEVTVTGSVQVGLLGVSAGSDSTVALGAGIIGVERIA